MRTQTSIARTSKATLTLERSDLLRVVFDDKAQVSLADAQQMVSAARRLTSGDRLPMLIDATRCSHINKDVRRHLQGEEAQSITYACAILAPMTAKSMIRNLLFDIDVADCIFRFFADERKAVRWLDEQRRAAEEGAAPNAGKKHAVLIAATLISLLTITAATSTSLVMIACGLIPIAVAAWFYTEKGGALMAVAISLLQLVLLLNDGQASDATVTLLCAVAIANVAFGFALGALRRTKTRYNQLIIAAYRNAAKIQCALQRFENKDYHVDPAPSGSVTGWTAVEIWQSIGRLGDVLKGHHQRTVKNTRSLVQRVEDQTHALKEMQNQLMQASKLSALGTMSASLAHELNNPIAVMVGYLETLREANLPLESKRQLGRIEESLKRMQQTVDHLRRFAREGRGSEFWRLTDVSQIVSDAFILLDPVIDAGKIRVRLELAEEDLTILGDTHLLESVLQNLVLNSRDAFDERPTENHREIYISTSRDQNFAYLTYRDNAHGIPPEIAGRVFDAFFTTKAENRGTGLGLSLARGVIEQHGGTIELHSHPPTGTTFKIRLPLAEKATPDLVETELRKGSAELSRHAKGRGDRILIVDDEPEICEYLRNMLRDHFLVDVTDSPLEALKMVGKERYSLIISDVRMPDMDGAQFVKEVHDRTNTKIPVLLVSGLSPHDRAVARALEIGALGLITKPFKSVENVVSKVLDIVKKDD